MNSGLSTSPTSTGAAQVPADKPTATRLWAWLGGLGLGLLFLALRWNNWALPLTRDEGEYAYAARLLQRGSVPYTDSFLQKPPMVAYSYALAQKLAPHCFWGPRVLAAVFAGLATALLGWMARREFGRGVAFPAMWLFTPMVLLPGIEQFPANTEMFLLLPLLGTVVVYVANRQRSGPWAWCFAGGLGATTLCYKYTALPLLVWVCLAWSLDEWKSFRNWRQLCRRWLAAALGGVVTATAVLALFLVRDGGRHLWECTISFNSLYARSGSFGLAALAWRLQSLWTHWWILFLLPGALVIWRPARLWFWLGLGLLAWLTTAMSWYGHYYTVVTPFWALLSAAALKPLTHWLAGRIAWPEAWLRRGLTGAIVALLCLSDFSLMMSTTEQFASAKLAGSNPFLESPAVAKRVSELTAPADLVFVAGSEPQILCYAGRYSPTRFVIAYPLMIPTPRAESYQREVIHDLQTRPPKVVVVARQNTSWAMERGSPTLLPVFLTRLLELDYDRVGGYVSEGPNTGWTEPLSESDLTRASLVVFRRKPL